MLVEKILISNLVILFMLLSINYSRLVDVEVTNNLIKYNK